MTKDFVRGLLRRAGYELRRADAPLHSMQRGLDLLAERIGNSGFVVVDVGVAEGTPELYAAFPPGRNRYLLVEANPAYRDSMVALADRIGAVAEFAFAGAAPGRVPFNLYADGRKASAYETHGRQPVRTVEVGVKTLDGMLGERCLTGSSVVLKIDAEGAELEVLGGAGETLKHCAAVIAEAGLVRRYAGGALFGDIVVFMREHGFVPFDIIGGGVMAGRLHLVDIIFIPEADL